MEQHEENPHTAIRYTYQLKVLNGCVFAASCGHSTEFKEFAKRNPITPRYGTVTGRFPRRQNETLTRRFSRSGLCWDRLSVTGQLSNSFGCPFAEGREGNRRLCTHA